jgi:tetratricopeptide (TPR) repeat protein
MDNPSAPLSVLLLLSSPLDAPVGVDGALAHLDAALRDVRAHARFVTHIAETDHVHGLLAQANRPRFPVLHYLGHGYKASETPHGALVFEDGAGGARFLDNFHLRVVLNPTNRPEPEFQVAVLMACHSESVALAMHALGVRHIVAVEASDTVLEAAAVAYFRRFYQVLLTGGTVADAHAAGRNAVLLDERLARNNPRTPQREAAKFKLLPETADHHRPLDGLTVGEAPVQIDLLPRLGPPHFISPPAQFIGRAGDQREVLERLGARRGLLIQGVSGVGKSALAWETACWLVARRRVRPEHVYFVSLNNVHSAEAAQGALALALGVQIGALPPAAAQRALQTALPAGALLVIDEAESAAHAGGLAFRRLLEALVQAPGAPLVLVTSQRDVGSAHLPVYTLPRLHPQAAFDLFVNTINLTSAEVAALDHADLMAVLQYVDRVPRAVELTAKSWRHARNLDLKPLLAELAARYEAVMRDPNYPDEIKSVVLGTTLAYDRLRARHPAAADLFVHLSLFPGGLPEAGVAAIFGEEARRQLALIHDDSLVERPWPDLLYLPTPLRLFAGRQLDATALAAVRQRWGAAVLRFYHHLDDEAEDGHVARLDASLQGAGDQMAAVIARYDHELASIEAWLDWAYPHEPCAGDRLRGPRLTALLENLYMVTDRLRASRGRLQAALAAAQRCRDRLGEANVHQALGDLALREDDLGEARRRYGAALAIYPEIGDRLGEANVQKALGDLALAERDFQQAFDFFRRALDVHTAIGDRLGLAADFGYMGRSAAAAGSHAQAILLMDQSLIILRSIDSRFGQLISLNDQGEAFWALEAQDAALGAWWQAQELAHAIGAPQARNLDQLFAQIAQQVGPDAWTQLQAGLAGNAEAWREQAVDAIRQQLEQAND